jgi:hypothetical protein
MAGYGIIIAILIMVGVIIAFTLRADFVTERAYGLLALALLAAVALGLLWPPVIDADTRIDSWGANSLANAMMDGFFTFATILAIALLGIVRLIEMAIARQWWWLGGLFAAMALMALTIFLPIFINSPGVSSSPDSSILRDAIWLASEAVVLLVCAGYGVRATWFRSAPTT